MRKYEVKKVNLNKAEEIMNEMAKDSWKVISTNLIIKDIGYNLYDLIITFEKEM